jgi:serine/threonine protein kinase
MLRCPKCSRIFQTGNQRFCTHDGGRLMPVSEVAHNPAPNGASNGYDAFETEASTGWQPRRQTGRLVLPSHIELTSNGFKAPENTNDQPSGTKANLANIVFPQQQMPPVIERKPTGRLVLPSEIPESFAPTGNRSIRPTGRLPISSKNTAALVGQNIKGRYQIEKILSQDETTVTYLGNDRFSDQRRVIIKLLLDDAPLDAEFGKRFYEEKVALSNINHPSIIGVLDSGELVEGKPFVVVEYVEGETLRLIMQQTGQFPATRAGRIIRQVGQALSEAHNNRLLHRNLLPGNIILKAGESGAEQVKVSHFGIAGFDGGQNVETFAYYSPERLAGEPLSPESDIFSLAVIAYEMLTGRMPFSGTLRVELLESQERGIIVLPTNLRLDLSPRVDTVLQKALAYDREERYHHAREFGEALFLALSENMARSSGQLAVLPEVAKPLLAEELDSSSAGDNDARQASAQNEISSPASETKSFASTHTRVEDKVVTPAPPRKVENKGKVSRLNFPLAAVYLLGALLLIGGLITLGFYLSRDGKENFSTISQPAPTGGASTEPRTDLINVPAQSPIQQTSPAPVTPPVPPAANRPEIPTGFVPFQNTKANLDGKLAENYVNFSLAYPKDWQSNENEGKPGAKNFLDISNRISNGLPLEQLLVSWYQSKGTFAADRANFPALSQKLAAAYSKEIPNFRKVSENKITFNGREAYEIKFAGSTTDAGGEKVQIWVRTIFLPVGNEKAKSGLTLTMLATSLAPALSSVLDVGEKGELKQILKTFTLSENPMPGL